MYFPFLRGKQFELLALREISEILSKNKDRVSPIIEPVKESSTLDSVLAGFKSSNINFSLIINPEVGDLQNKFSQVLELVTNVLGGYSNFQFGIYVSTKTKFEAIHDTLTKIKKITFRLTLIHNEEVAAPSKLLDSYSKIAPVENNVINFSSPGIGSRYYRLFDKTSLIRLEDFFPTQERNADFLEIEDSKFSEEHLFYKQEGFKGFSDYLTIGDNYLESGFLPHAIAIHLTYVDKDNKFRIKHFVSESNEDISDVGGKFLEALKKLVDWSRTLKSKTKAIKIFEELYKTQHFPGLGTLKKLSIMHHIELVLNVIE